MSGVCNHAFLFFFLATNELSQGVKDAPAPRPNKKPRLVDDDEGPVAGPSKITKDTSIKKHDDEDQPRNAQLDQFLQVMQPQTKKGPSWANEKQTSHPTMGSSSLAPPEPSTSDLGYGKPKDQKDSEDMQVDVEPAKELSDLDWMRQRMTSQVDEKVFTQDDEDDNNDNTVPSPNIAESVEPALPKDPVIETLLQTSRLFIRNLVFSCTEDDLMELFKPYGEINQVRLSATILLCLDDSSSSVMITFIGTSDSLPREC
jgi:multiple RNA-binding domain-containing protein 1